MNRPSTDSEIEEGKKKTLDFYFQVRAFLEIYEELDDSYEIYVQHDREGTLCFEIVLYSYSGQDRAVSGKRQGIDPVFCYCLCRCSIIWNYYLENQKIMQSMPDLPLIRQERKCCWGWM